MRTGMKTGARRLRTTATSRARIRTKISATTKMNTFRLNFDRSVPRESQNTSGSKNASLTCGHPDEFTIANASSPKTITVLATAIATPRAPSALSGARIFDRRSPLGGVYPPPGRLWYFSGAWPPTERLRQEGRVRLVGQPLLVDLVERAVRLHLLERQVHALDERAAGLERHREVLVGRGAELAHDDTLLDLHRRDEEGRRQVHDDPVDVAVLQVRDGLRQVVVDGRLLGRLDLVRDDIEACRADRRAELRVLQVGDRGRVGDRRALVRHEGLVHVVVGLAEVHGVVAPGLVRDLLQHEVEVLGSGREGLIERDRHERHVVGEGEPEPFGDLGRDRPLVALALGRVVELELGVVGGAALPPRWE